MAVGQLRLVFETTEYMNFLCMYYHPRGPGPNLMLPLFLGPVPPEPYLYQGRLAHRKEDGACSWMRRPKNWHIREGRGLGSGQSHLHHPLRFSF